MESADRRATAEREAGEARGRETQDVAQRLATVERRVEELGEGVTGLEVGTATLAEQFARLEAGTATAVSPAAASAWGSPAGAPDLARGALRPRDGKLPGGRTGQAVLDFEEFADKHPGHPLTPSAHFWIGEAYFRSRDFEQAASRYQKAIDLAAMGDRTPDALLRLGLALRSLHREDRARDVWPGSSGTFQTATRPFARAPSSASPCDPSAHRSLASKGSRSTLRHNGGIGAWTFLQRPSVFLTTLGAGVYDGACFANV